MKVTVTNYKSPTIHQNGQWRMLLAIFICVIAIAITLVFIFIDVEKAISPAAILCSAFFGGLIALYSIQQNVRTARVKATLDMIVESESSEYYQHNLSIFQALVDDEKIFHQLAQPLCSDPRRRTLNDFLNHYELIALSIRKQILDEAFYQEWMMHTYVRHFEQAWRYIAERRKSLNNDEIYAEFETLAKKWGANIDG